jgi:hypothetical protein
MLPIEAMVGESSPQLLLSRRALETFKNGKAWDLMKEVKRRPAYDPHTQKDGVINMSGALNSLMRDWMGQYINENPPKNAVKDGAATPRLLSL